MANQKKLMILNIDGAPEAMLYELLDAGKLPNLAAIFKNGARTKGCSSVFPSTTVTCQTSIFTGLYPNRHHISSFRILHREKSELRFDCYDDMNSALDYYGVDLFGFPDIVLKRSRPDGNLGRNMNPKEKSIYHAFTAAGRKSAVYLHLFSHGATRTVIPTKMDFVKYALAYKGYAHWKVWDGACVDTAVADIRRNGLPDLFTLYLAGGDSIAHYVGGLKAMREYLVEVVDPLWGRFVKAVEEKARLDDIIWTLTADHGHIDTRHKDEFAISPQKVFGELVNPGGKYRLFNEEKPNLAQMNCAFFQGLGNFRVHLKNGRTGSWKDRADLEEDILPMAQRLWKTQEKLGRHIDFLMVDDPKAGAYRVLDVENDDKLIPVAEFFAGKEKNFPQAARRMEGYRYERSPEIILFPNEQNGYHYATHPFHSIHGSLEGQSSYVPLIFAGEGIVEGELPDEDVCIVDIAPTAAALVGVKLAGADGKALSVAADRALAV